MFKLVVLMLVQATGFPGVQPGSELQLAECGCLCVDGVAKTLCQSVEEARRQPNACPAGQRCPAPPTEDASPGTYDPPVDGAHNCREVRIWDEAAADYTGVKVCDVFSG